MTCSVPDDSGSPERQCPSQLHCPLLGGPAVSFLAAQSAVSALLPLHLFYGSPLRHLTAKCLRLPRPFYSASFFSPLRHSASPSSTSLPRADCLCNVGKMSWAAASWQIALCRAAAGLCVLHRGEAGRGLRIGCVCVGGGINDWAS